MITLLVLAALAIAELTPRILRLNGRWETPPMEMRRRMRALRLGVVLLALAGVATSCTNLANQPQSAPSTKAPVNNSVARPATEAEIYQQLWTVCHARRLTYIVSCYDTLGCNAEAWDSKIGNYNAMLQKPHYTAHADGPTEAVTMLLGLLNGQPNAVPSDFSYPIPKSTFDTGEVKP